MKKKLFPFLFSFFALLLLWACAEKSENEPDSGNDTEETVEIETYGAVDLGLSVKWAACDLGADYCYEYGTKYQWGDQRTNCLLDICGTSYDQATKILGDDWRLPTKTEAEELIKKCKWIYMAYRGVYGFAVKGPSGKAIFVRQYSDLWTGICDMATNNAYYIYVKAEYSDPKSVLNTGRRTSNYHIRPVYVGY